MSVTALPHGRGADPACGTTSRAASAILNRMPPTRDEIWEKFVEAVPYELYSFQEEALLAWFESEDGVLVCAPTGMGKTLIAEAAIFEALHTRTRLYYTTPLIALTDQKYREIRDRAVAWGFDERDVGLITGNRKENPDALVRVVVAEILVNHLLSDEDNLANMPNVGAVVMDEFHSFNDRERGIVWELGLVMLPKHVRVMLLSATVGNPWDFADWLNKKHDRKLAVVLTDERRVPLEFNWIEDKLLPEQLTRMVDDDRTPALVFCFNRDECWEVAEKLKGLPLTSAAQRKEIEAALEPFADDLTEGVGPKLRQMLLRGVGVHHAGVLPRHKMIVEDLFLQKLVPFVVCTETLAAGINLPARSVVLSTLIKGPPREKKLIPASSAHQMFGRAGRPQFDTNGYVYAVAHDDDVKINKWKEKYDKIDPNSKDPGIMRARKDLERKKPSRRKTEQYWTEGQFKTLIEAGPAKLLSRSMIPYSVLIFQMTRDNDLRRIREILAKRFNSLEHIEKFQKQLEFMIDNLAALGYITRPAGDDTHVVLDESIYKLLTFRSVDPLYGAYLCKTLAPADDREKLVTLESVLEMPWPIVRKTRIPRDFPKGPLQENEIEPLMRAMGVKLDFEKTDEEQDEQRRHGWLADDPDAEEYPPTFPEMLKIAFEAKLAAPEPVFVQPKWLAGAAFDDFNREFFKFVKSRDLVKQEGLVLRHLLRLAILAGEFFTFTEDPSYVTFSESATDTCRRVDEKYTDHFLAEAEATKQAALEGVRG
ncbi:MAG: DEAD/DEAH box helicase [Phycisphaerae bacterium]